MLLAEEAVRALMFVPHRPNNCSSSYQSEALIGGIAPEPHVEGSW